jgi:hypothetical protein
MTQLIFQLKKSILLLSFLTIGNLIIGSHKPNPELLFNKKNEHFKPSVELNFVPFAMFFAGLEGGLEIQHKPKQALRINAGYYVNDKATFYNNTKNNGGWDLWWNPSRHSNWSSIRTEIHYKFFNRTEESNLRFYVAPFIVNKWATVDIEMQRANPDNPNVWEVTNERHKAFATSGGILLGLKERITDRIYLDMFFGGGLTFFTNGDKDELNVPVIHPYTRSIHPRFGLSINFGI